MNNNSYSDRRVINVGRNQNNKEENQLIARIQQDFREGGYLSRVVARTPKYDWRILFVSDSEQIANKDKINRALLDVPSSLVGRTVWNSNQVSLRIKGEQLGQIGIYPNHVHPDIKQDTKKHYQAIVSTAYHEASHAERGQKHLLVPQNSLAEEYRAFRREESIKRSLDSDFVDTRPSLKERAALFDEKVLRLYYEDVIAGNYSLGTIPKFIQQGSYRLPYEQKRPGKQVIDQRNFANITYHAFKTGKTKLLEQYGYRVEVESNSNDNEEKITVSGNEQPIIISTIKNGYLKPEGDGVDLSEADILNSYQIARQIEAERIKQQNNSSDLSNFSTNHYNAQKPADNRDFSPGLRKMLSTGLLKANTSSISHRSGLKPKMLQRNKSKAIDTKNTTEETTSIFSRYLPSNSIAPDKRSPNIEAER